MPVGDIEFSSRRIRGGENPRSVCKRMDAKLIRAAELAEMRAWEDMYWAAPAGFRATHAL